MKPGWLNFDPGDGEVRGLKAHVGEYSHVAFSLVLVVPEAVLINWSGVAKENYGFEHAAWVSSLAGDEIRLLRETNHDVGAGRFEPAIKSLNE